MGEFRMPSLGADMEAGTIVEWRVAPGDEVHRGDIVAVVDTEKSTIEVEVFENGVVETLLVGIGEEVPVGTPLARIAAPGTAVAPEPVPTAVAPEPVPVVIAPEPALSAPPPVVPAAAPLVASAVAAEPGSNGGNGGLVGSPLVRKLAEDSHVDLAALQGSGPGGVVTRHDVEAATAPRPRVVTPPARPAPPGARPRVTPRARRLAAELGVDLGTVADGGRPVTGGDIEAAAATPLAPSADVGPVAPEPVVPERQERPDSLEKAAKPDKAATMRHAIAAVMARSKREIPHYYLSEAVDMSRALAWLDAANAERGVADRILPAALLLKATALTAARTPEMNGFWRDDAFVAGEGVHLGVAISLRGGGLLAPCIHDADALSLDEMMAALRDLVERARSGRLRGSEMSDGTLTVTNLGDQGVDEVFPVIYAPQVAIVGFGRIAERPWAEGGMVGARPVVTATLAADHRVSDGLRGARFLDSIARSLQDPGAL